jgi:hypothetical protein
VVVGGGAASVVGGGGGGGVSVAAVVVLGGGVTPPPDPGPCPDVCAWGDAAIVAAPAPSAIVATTVLGGIAPLAPVVGGSC